MTIRHSMLLLTAVALLGCAPSRLFDSAMWRTPASYQATKPPTQRQMMVSDLRSRALPGKSRGEIEALLGPSLDTPYFSTTGRDLVYLLGPEHGFFAIDNEWLLIWLDKQGRFDRSQIVTD
jgi:hypothetical protein